MKTTIGMDADKFLLVVGIAFITAALTDSREFGWAAYCALIAALLMADQIIKAIQAVK